MAINPNKPDNAWQISFTDPNDPSGPVPVWHDFTKQVIGVSGNFSRGDDYELGQPFAQSPTFTLKDTNQDLNPDNPSSPYAGLIQPYRPVLWQCMWPQPNTPMAAGLGNNLLNTKAWRGNNQDVVDGSFESWTFGSPRPWWIQPVGGTDPEFGTTTPHSGLTYVFYNTVASALGQGVGFLAATMPGRQYTASCYINQAVASTQQIFAGSSAGTSTATSGSYVRLSVTFTATQPQTTIIVQTTGTALAGVVRVDDLQLEVGAVATAFSNTGPVIYPRLRGYAERFTPSYQDNGFTGYVTIPVVDSLPALNAITIAPEYPSALMALDPDFYWSLDAGSSATVFPEVSGNGGTPLAPLPSKQGAGNGLTPGSSITIPGEPGAVGVQLDPGPVISFNQQTTGLGAGIGTSYRSAFSFPASISGTWGESAAIWFKGTQYSTAIQSPILLLWNWQLGFGAISSALAVFAFPDTGSGAFLDIGLGLTGIGIDIPGQYLDGNPHLLTISLSQVAGGNTTLNVMLDGVLYTDSATTASAGTLLGPANTILVGSNVTTQQQWVTQGTMAHMALWNRALSNTEMASLWTAGHGAFSGETTGARVKRHLAIGGFTAASTALTRISPGETTLGPPTWSGSINLLTDTQNNADAELGQVWTAPDGALVFEDRNDHFLRLTPRWFFGENLGSGETPYLGDVATDRDPTYVYGNVQFERANGATAVGGQAADIATVSKRTFPRTFERISDLATDAQAQYLADWIFYTHWVALTRLETITIDPASNPALWHAALSVEVGQRIRWTRRIPGANNGAGLTISLDFFVSKVTPTNIDFTAGTDQVQLQCTPIGNAAQPGSFQPWILEDPTYGVLGSTTRLAP